MSPVMHSIHHYRRSQLLIGRLALSVLFVAGVALRATADDSHPKLDPAVEYALGQATDTSTVRVIVTAAAGKYSTMRTHVVGTGRKIDAEHKAFNMLTAELRKADISMLESDVAAARISLDHTVLSTGTTTSSAVTPIDYGMLGTLGLVTPTVTGKGVGVAVIDSGIQPSLNLPSYAFFDFTGSTKSAADDYGHGTHVAGLIRAFSNLTGNPLQTPMIGVSTGTRLISMKVLNSTGQGYTSTVLTALEYLLNNRGTLGVDVANLSLGHLVTESGSSDPLVQAVEALSHKGIIMVVAAGNLGLNPTTGLPAYAGITSPGNAPSAITVGALDTRQTVTRTDDQIATYSSRGPSWYDGLLKPDIVAPGQGLVSMAAIGSTLYTRYPDLRVLDGTGAALYMRLSGTSMATAVTTGVVALMIEKHRQVSSVALTPNDVKAVLQFTAIPVNGPDGAPDVLTQGAGAINPPGAIAVAAALTGSPDPTMRSTTIVDPTTTIASGMTYSWSRTVIWGHTCIYGDTVYANEPAWASQTTWGSTVVWGHSWAASGDLVWDSAPTWSANTIWDPVAAPSTAGQSWPDVGAQAKTVIWGHGGGGPY
jgi:serine protease AprX